MKKVLVAVISCQDEIYAPMVGVSEATWDSVNVEGVETLFYFGNPQRGNTHNKVFFNIDESLFSMGFKDLAFFDYALKNKEWDYMARVNASCFVHKQNLVNHCQELPDKDLFAGLEVTCDEPWVWGGGMFLLSRDVVQKLVDNKSMWEHSKMEDMAMSQLYRRLGGKFTPGRACSIDAKGAGWSCLVYGYGQGFDFSHMNEFKFPEGQYFFRIKQDNQRHLEAGIMHELKNKL